MEITCSRCHQPVPAESCYCPSCGLPQLVYSAEPGSIPASSERWQDAVRDAASIDWKSGMRAALMLAVPAGLLSSGVSRLSPFGIFWMSAAAAWAVVLYMRSQRPAWITIGAGARIGLVTGLMAGWLSFGVSGVYLFVARVVQHQGVQIDSGWQDAVNRFYQQLEAQSSPPADVLQQWDAQRRFILSPEGFAGSLTFGLTLYSLLLVLFAIAGGALGARLLSRRRPEI